jgi:NADPH:quinone reductase-like Zn-dependent oxidoreductase
MADFDFRGTAAQLLADAAAQIVAAPSSATAGAERIVEILMSIDDNPALREQLRLLGEEISSTVRVFLETVGEDTLITDPTSVGLVACAALTFAAEEADGPPPGDDPS